MLLTAGLLGCVLLAFVGASGCVSTSTDPTDESDVMSSDAASTGQSIDFDGAVDRVGTFFNPGVADLNDMCCPTGSWISCVADVGDTCGAGKTLTACYGCDDEGDPACTPKSFQDNPWVWMGPVPGNTYFCAGLAFKRGALGGQYVHETCAQDGCFTTWGDGGVCTTDIGPASPNPCEPIGAAATWAFEGMMTRMCCQSTGGAPEHYNCTPRSADEASCSGMPVGWTTSAYCFPCTTVGGGITDPDGAGLYNTNGTWDLKGNSADEWPGSISCTQFSEPALPNWTGDVCNITVYNCKGTLVRSDGIIIEENCV